MTSDLIARLEAGQTYERTGLKRTYTREVIAVEPERVIYRTSWGSTLWAWRSSWDAWVKCATLKSRRPA